MALFNSYIRRNKLSASKKAHPPEYQLFERQSTPSTLGVTPQLALLPTDMFLIFHFPKMSEQSVLCSLPCLSEPLCPIYRFLWLALSLPTKKTLDLFSPPLPSPLLFIFFPIVLVAPSSNGRPWKPLYAFCVLPSLLYILFVFKS